MQQPLQVLPPCALWGVDKLNHITIMIIKKSQKKLRWQTELEKVGFELGEIGGRITTEAKPECPMLAPGCEGVAQRLPAPDIFGSEIVGGAGLYPRRCGSD